jgi:hypothetical protein
MDDTARPRISAVARRNESDLVILELVRLVRQEPWSPERAARRLLDKRPSSGALRLARARVLRAQHERDSAVVARAASTIREALAQLDGEPAGDARLVGPVRRGDVTLSAGTSPVSSAARG